MQFRRARKTLNLLCLAICAFGAVGALQPAARAASDKAPATGADATDYIYRARQGDTLIGLGKTLLERPNDWPQVQKLNAIADPRRIPTGRLIRIPLRLLKGAPVSGRIEQAVGDARLVPANGAPAPARTGDAIAEHTRIETGADGYVTVRLADGSLLHIQSASRAELEQSRQYPQGNFFSSAWRLFSGRVEALVTELTGGEPRFEVRTPQSTLGVRGTEFRVASDEQRAQTRGEVLAGTVDVGAKAGAPTRVPAGFATIVDATGKPSPPVALLPAPDLAGLPALHERPLVRFDVPAVPGATAYRAQVASEREFQSVVAESLTPTGALRFANLPDQDWFLRVRAIDPRGIEGHDAVFTFRLKARPEPPIHSAPPPRSKQRTTSVEFAWTRNPEASAYDFQLAREPTFDTPLQERRSIAETGMTLEGLPPGTYFWRLASLRSATDRGPWGDPATFTLAALPEKPAARIDAATVRFSWAGEPGQSFEFQLARDRAFADLIVERTLDEPELVLPKPAPGVYFLRYRARDADGYLGPFTSPQTIELARCVLDGSGRCVGSASGPLPAQ